MLHIKEEMLYAAVRSIYHEHISTGNGIDYRNGEPFDKYAAMLSDKKMRAALVRLQGIWPYVQGAAERWTKDGWIDLNVVTGDHAYTNDLLIRYMSLAAKCQVKIEDASPLADPVARWLAETLRPRSIHWSGDDPITDVLRAVLINGSAHTAERVAARTAKRLLELIQQPARPPSAFFEAVARLRHAELRSVQFSTLLRELFGESLRLRPVRGGLAYGGKVALVRIDPRVNSWSMVLWASTGEPVICDMAQRRSSFDFANFENMQHLYKCYNAHNKRSDNR